MAGPSWFSGFDAVFDIVFMLVTLSVAVVGYRGYKFLQDKKYLLLSKGFLFLSASYLLLMLTNVFTYLEARSMVPLFVRMMQISRTIAAGFILHALLFLAGLLMLVFLYYKIEDGAMRLLLSALVLFGFLMAWNMTGGFYILISILMLAIIVQLFRNWRAKSKSLAFLVFAGFSAVFIGEVLLAVLFLHESMYVASNLVTLAGYVAILVAQVKRK